MDDSAPSQSAAICKQSACKKVFHGMPGIWHVRCVMGGSCIPLPRYRSRTRRCSSYIFTKSCTPPPLRAFTRPAHRRPHGLSPDRHAAALSVFHDRNTASFRSSQIGVGAALGRGADPTRSRPKDSSGIQSIQPTHWLWLHRGSTTVVWPFQCLLPGESFGLDRGQGLLLPRFVKARRGGGVPVG